MRNPIDLGESQSPETGAHFQAEPEVDDTPDASGLNPLKRGRISRTWLISFALVMFLVSIP